MGILGLLEGYVNHIVYCKANFISGQFSLKHLYTFRLVFECMNKIAGEVIDFCL